MKKEKIQKSIKSHKDAISFILNRISKKDICSVPYTGAYILKNQVIILGALEYLISKIKE